MSYHASGSRPRHRVMSRHMTRDSPDHGAFDATFGTGGAADEEQTDQRQYQCMFHFITFLIK